MYPTIEEIKNRRNKIDEQLRILYKERDMLNKAIEKLEAEDKILINIVKLYELIREDGQKQDR